MAMFWVACSVSAALHRVGQELSHLVVQGALFGGVDLDQLLDPLGQFGPRRSLGAEEGDQLRGGVVARFRPQDVQEVLRRMADAGQREGCGRPLRGLDRGGGDGCPELVSPIDDVPREAQLAILLGRAIR